ncbi:MAG: phage terminase large subunit [Rickettsiales bacterium]
MTFQIFDKSDNSLYINNKLTFSNFIRQSFEVVNPGADYLPNWHIDAIAEYLEAARESKITRLVINMPPRTLKSVCVTVAWPAWLLGNDPKTRIMAASYSTTLSLKHALDTRLIVSSDRFKAHFPECMIERGENQKHKFVTTARGFRFATSVGGTATGEGGDILIVDDPLNPSQAMSKTRRDHANNWFDQTFSTRLNNKKTGRIVVVMQRLHPEDLSGHLLAKGGWEQLKLPAIAETQHSIYLGDLLLKTRHAGEPLHTEREDMALIERAKNDLGSFAFAAQYQQEPLHTDSAMLSSHWLQRYDRLPETFTRVVQSWDTAIKAEAKNDASVCITFGEYEHNHYIIDVLSLRAEYPELKRTVIEQAARWDVNSVLIEDKASGQSLLQDLKRETNLPLVARNPKSDKLTRFAAITAMIEAGRLHLPKQAPWLTDFETELLSFPHVPHDDQVDSLTQYFNWLRERQVNQHQIRRLT